MEEPSYKFNKIEDRLTFEFDSVSSTKTIKKLIEFSLIDKDYLLYNLALVDILPDGTSSDVSKSNNQDMPMVLSTVFQSILYFLSKIQKLEYSFKEVPKREPGFIKWQLQNI